MYYEVRMKLNLGGGKICRKGEGKRVRLMD